MRVIGFEEHFATRQFLEGPGREFVERMSQAAAKSFLRDTARLVEQLTDVGNGRIAEMDAAGVDVAVLSLTAPGLEQLAAAEAVPFAHDTNDYLADAIRHNPQRFRGFAALPTADPSAAADELERVVRNHGFVGAEINGHCQGRRFDDEFFWPILECAEALGVPIYLHPTRPPQAVVDLLYAGNYPPAVTELLSIAAWGWHIETAIHVLRLILSGAFDRFPQLQLMIGHMGEVLPFMLPRLDSVLTTSVTALQRAPSEYLRHNVYYTFSGFNWTPQFLELLLQVGVDRMMFSTDYPYQSMTDATAFLAGLSLTPSDRERIAHGNAETLLNI
jgi:predicted TIM-barrel fold metal-dependent hydrolase